MLFWQVLLLSLLTQTDASNLRSLMNVTTTATLNTTLNTTIISAGTTSSDACAPGLSVIFAQSVCRAVGAATALFMVFFTLAVVYALVAAVMICAGIIAYTHMGCVLLMGGKVDPTDRIVYVE